MEQSLVSFKHDEKVDTSAIDTECVDAAYFFDDLPNTVEEDRAFHCAPLCNEWDDEEEVHHGGCTERIEDHHSYDLLMLDDSSSLSLLPDDIGEEEDENKFATLTDISRRISSCSEHGSDDFEADSTSSEATENVLESECSLEGKSKIDFAHKKMPRSFLISEQTGIVSKSRVKVQNDETKRKSPSTELKTLAFAMVSPLLMDNAPNIRQLETSRGTNTPKPKISSTQVTPIGKSSDVHAWNSPREEISCSNKALCCDGRGKLSNKLKQGQYDLKLASGKGVENKRKRSLRTAIPCKSSKRPCPHTEAPSKTGDRCHEISKTELVPKRPPMAQKLKELKAQQSVRFPSESMTATDGSCAAHGHQTPTSQLSSFQKESCPTGNSFAAHQCHDELQARIHQKLVQLSVSMNRSESSRRCVVEQRRLFAQTVYANLAGRQNDVLAGNESSRYMEYMMSRSALFSATCTILDRYDLYHESSGAAPPPPPPASSWTGDERVSEKPTIYYYYC